MDICFLNISLNMATRIVEKRTIISKEKERGLRVRLLLDKGGDVLRDVMVKHLQAKAQGKTYYQLFTTGQVKRNLKTMKHQGKLKQDQWNHLCPQSRDVDVFGFDITLIFLVLIDVCQLTSPSNGWKLPIDPQDHSESADILRLKTWRDKRAHSVLGIAYRSFYDFWNDVSQTLLRLGIDRKEIDNIENCSLDGTTSYNLKLANRENSELKQKLITKNRVIRALRIALYTLLVIQLLFTIRGFNDNAKFMQKRALNLVSIAAQLDGNISEIVRMLHNQQAWVNSTLNLASKRLKLAQRVLDNSSTTLEKSRKLLEWSKENTKYYEREKKRIRREQSRAEQYQKVILQSQESIVNFIDRCDAFQKRNEDLFGDHLLSKNYPLYVELSRKVMSGRPKHILHAGDNVEEQHWKQFAKMVRVAALMKAEVAYIEYLEHMESFFDEVMFKHNKKMYLFMKEKFSYWIIPGKKLECRCN